MPRVNLRQILLAVSSMQVTVASLVALCVLVFWGTLYQASSGIYAAQQSFFHAWILFAFGVIPFPAVKLIVGVLSLNLLLAIPVRFGLTWRWAGLLLTHVGVAVLMAGTVFTHYLSKEGMLMLWEGQSAQETLVFPSGSQGESVDISRIGHMALPVTVKLIDFTRKDYRGTTVAADYQSRLHLTGPGVDRDVVVSMNRPLRLGGYTFFQSSYLQQDGLESTSLTVVANPVRYLPYAASIAICLGLVLHVVMRLVAHIRARGRKA